MKLISPRMICGNRGDLLSRFGILAALRRLGFDDVAVFCDSERDVAPLGYTTLPYGKLYNFLPPRAGRRALRRSDVVVWTGGLDLQDDSSLLKLMHTWLTFLSYRTLGCRIIMANQGAGPLTTRAGRWLARRILNLVDCFIARDSGTLRLLQGLGTKTRLVRAHDGIFLPDLDSATVTPADQATVDRLTADAAGQKLIGFNLRLWFHFSNSIIPYHWAKTRYQERARGPMDRLVEASIDLIRRLRSTTGGRVVLLSMYEPDSHPWEDDLPYLRRVKDGLRNDPDVVLVEEPLGLGGFCRLVGRLNLMIGTRLHSTLTALRLGVPAINLAYTLKCKDIFGDLGLAAHAVELESFMSDPAAVASLARSVLADQGAPGRIRQIVRQRCAENFQVLDEVLAAMVTATAPPPARAA